MIESSPEDSAIARKIDPSLRKIDTPLRKMDTQLRKIDTQACKSEQLILRRLASIGQAHIAEQLGVNESTVSRWKDGEIARWAKILALLGLKVVPTDACTYRKAIAGALWTLARDTFEREGGFEDLSEEDD